MDQEQNLTRPGFFETPRGRYVAVGVLILCALGLATWIWSGSIVDRRESPFGLTWQTYRNEEYGFEFEYPEDWVIKLDNHLRPGDDPSFLIAQVEFGPDTERSFSAPDFRVTISYEFSEESLGTPSFNSIGIYPTTEEFISDYGLYYLYTKKGGRVYSFMFRDQADRTLSEQHRHSISTFRFVE